MRVREQHLQSKTGDERTCEDAIFVSDTFAAVIDGTTSAVPDSGNEAPGRKGAKHIQAAMANIPHDADAESCFRILNDEIAGMYRSEGTYETVARNPEYRASASVIVYSRYRSEVWLVGDCQALAGDTLISAWKDVDRVLAEVRAMYLESELLRGRTIEQLLSEDTGRQYINELRVRQKLFQNNEQASGYGFSVVDGFLDAGHEAVQVHKIPEDLETLVLASDGYPELRPTLQESEQALAETIREDPLCFRRFKSTKGVYTGNVSFDDRAYLSLNLSE